MSKEFWQPLASIDITSHNLSLRSTGSPCSEGEREPGIRSYCTQSGSYWKLQIRAPLKTAGGRPGKHFVIATASLDRVEMRTLRDALTAHLEEAEANDVLYGETASTSDEG